MKIVFQHATPLPVLKYGGTERILFWHMKQLVKLGHKVTLIGHKDCLLDDTGIELITFKGKNSWLELIPRDADILHLQYNYSPKIHIPIINTLHGNGQPSEIFSKNTVFVGKKHAENHNATSYIHNAIDLEEYPFQRKNKEKIHNLDNFLFLAKASWSVKNLKDCIKACKASKKHLHIAGGRSFSLSSYIHNHGLVGHEMKMTLFSKIDALLFPVRWNEPFGIAMIEAMSQGIPVIGSSNGSLPEIITNETGILCNNYDEFRSAINNKSNNFDPLIIRKYIEDHFSIKSYSERYLEYYQKVINGEFLNKNPPRWNLSTPPEELISFQK